MKYKNIEEIEEKCKEYETVWSEISNLKILKNVFREAALNGDVYIMTKELCCLTAIYGSFTEVKFGNPHEHIDKCGKYIQSKYHLINMFHKAYNDIEKEYCQHALIGDFDIRQSFFVNNQLIDWGYYNRNLKTFMEAIREAQRIHPDQKGKEMEKYYKEEDDDEFLDLCVTTYTYPELVIASFKTVKEAIRWQVYPDYPEEIDGKYWARQPAY